MNPEEMKAYLDDPPPETAQVCFMYRQSIGKRQQAQQRLAEARRVVSVAGAELNQAIGTERGLREAVEALANPAEIPNKLQTPGAAEGNAE